MNSLIRAMVDRFLGWRLPKDFAPDCHISFKLPDPTLNPNPSWPTGTNLLTADQAERMFESILTSVADDASRWRYARMLGFVNDAQWETIERSRGEPQPVTAAEEERSRVDYAHMVAEGKRD